jgi:hypothetical protein
VAIGLKVLVGDTKLVGSHLGDALQGGLLGDFDVGCHGGLVYLY